ncbi:hypothetical protein [Halomonas sp. C05BenzN]|uniref:hypothetical protein n=1 Tax=Halomonas sp. C05BenzN TaxID=3411041 RepID=UPI003B946C1C
MAIIRTPRRYPLLLALLGAGLVTGCGDDNGGSASTGNPAVVDALHSQLEALEAGQSTLTLTGAVTSTGDTPRDARASQDVYRPALGGGASRRGSNAEGPYALTLYTDAVHESAPDETVSARVSLVLPEGAEAGQTYAIAAFRDADEEQVQAHVRGDGEIGTIGRQVQGSLYLAELGEEVAAAWRLEAADGDDDEASRVEAEGAVAGLAFTPQREARYEITVNGESDRHLGRVAIHESPGGFDMSIGNRILLSLPAAVEAGDYALSDRSDDGVIRVSLMRHEVEEVSGTLLLRERNGVFDAEITLEASGEDEVRLSGDLEELSFDR